MILLTELALMLIFSKALAWPSPPNWELFGGSPHPRRQSEIGNNLTVDLGYEVYEGVYNESTGLNTWFGIRFAAPPTGNLRWQAPQPPTSNRASVIQANQYGPQCPQSSNNHPDVNGSGPDNGTYGDEDCLFLNVYAPAQNTSLPVLFWIHGGGYGANTYADADFTEILGANKNNFVGIEIQYRLNAFGFLSSDEVFQHGVVNAGLLDEQFALQWVQEHISQFGGNPSAVTIFGESAGGGSVMLLDMAYGGTLGTTLFQNSIAASPYLPMQHAYNDSMPTQLYNAFAIEAGCPPIGSSNQSTFQCLVLLPSDVLQRASFNVSASGLQGTYQFLPVTDGDFVRDLPSRQLLNQHVNGQRALLGNNANEGVNFTPQNITTEAELTAYLQRTFPLFTPSDINNTLATYPSLPTPDDPTAPLFSTLGYTGPTAVNQSEVATGHQQRANAIYAETTFICPAYWLAEAYSPTSNRTSYKYQYSVPLAGHASDVSSYFGPANTEQGPDFALAFRQIIGNFVVTGDPSLSAPVANGASAPDPNAPNSATAWPPFTTDAPMQLNLNETGGTPYEATPEEASGAPFNVVQHEEPGLMNDFGLYDAFAWEGGRGARCEFWRSVGARLPE